jgi:hypothetical protein
MASTKVAASNQPTNRVAESNGRSSGIGIKFSAASFFGKEVRHAQEIHCNDRPGSRPGRVFFVRHATTLSASLTVDNGFTAYLSTSDSVLGNQLVTGTDWGTEYNFSTSLVAGPNCAYRSWCS